MTVPRRRSLGQLCAFGIAIGLVVLLNASACFLPTGCDTVLGISYHPMDTTIAVGQSFHPALTLTNCGGTKRLSPELRYYADDTAIVAVDSYSGVVTGRRVGSTNAYTSAAQYGVVAKTGVTVR